MRVARTTHTHYIQTKPFDENWRVKHIKAGLGEKLRYKKLVVPLNKAILSVFGSAKKAGWVQTLPPALVKALEFLCKKLSPGFFPDSTMKVMFFMAVKYGNPTAKSLLLKTLDSSLEKEKEKVEGNGSLPPGRKEKLVKSLAETYGKVSTEIRRLPGSPDSSGDYSRSKEVIDDLIASTATRQNTGKESGSEMEDRAAEFEEARLPEDTVMERNFVVSGLGKKSKAEFDQFHVKHPEGVEADMQEIASDIAELQKRLKAVKRRTNLLSPVSEDVVSAGSPDPLGKYLPSVVRIVEVKLSPDKILMDLDKVKPSLKALEETTVASKGGRVYVPKGTPVKYITGNPRKLPEDQLSCLISLLAPSATNRSLSISAEQQRGENLLAGKPLVSFTEESQASEEDTEKVAAHTAEKLHEISEMIRRGALEIVILV